MCREEVLSNILESNLIDTNTKIAFMIARQVGWPVDFEYSGGKAKMRMIVPCQKVEETDSFVKVETNPDQTPV